MPEEFMDKWFKKIKPQWKTAFYAAAFFGLLTHLFILTNYLPHHDGIIRIYTPQNGFLMGRFFLTPFNGIGSFFDLPVINGVLSILFLTLTAVTLTELFQLKKKISIILTAGLLTAFPVITSTMSYMFTANGYMAASFVTVLALLITWRTKYGFLPGAFLLYLAVGVYQANFPFLLTMATLFFINEILFFQSSLRNLLHSIFRFMLMAVLGMGLYFLTYKLYTNFFSGDLHDYQGASEIGSSTASLLETIPLILERMVEFFFRGFASDFPVNLFEVLNVLLFILIGVATLAAIIESRHHQKRGMLILAVSLIVSLPLSAFSLYFINPDIWYHMLMVLSVISFYLLPVLIYDKLTIPDGLTKFTSWSTVILLGVIILNFAIIANIAYLNMNLKFEKSQAVTSRIVDRVEQTEGVNKDTPVALYGTVPIDSEVSDTIGQKIPEVTGPMQPILLRDSRHFESMMNNFLGASFKVITEEEELLEISQSETYEDMGIWPAASSIQMVDGVLIIKMEE